MINFAVRRGGGAIRFPQDHLLQMEARLRALSELEQDEADRAVLTVPHQPQMIGFQRTFRPGSDQLRQPFRSMNQKKSPPYFSAWEAAPISSRAEHRSSRRARGVALLAGPPEK